MVRPFGVTEFSVFRFQFSVFGSPRSGREMLAQGFYEPTFVKSVNLGVISGGLTREETKRTRS
jgi:hypothetical protein